MAATRANSGPSPSRLAIAPGRSAAPHQRFRPGAVLGSSSRAGWPSGLIGMLVLVAAIEMVVARRWAVVCDPVAFSWRFSARAAEEQVAGCAVLCAGDSLAKHGLVPPVIADRSGQRAYNLAAAAAPAPLTYFLLRRALDAGARPRAVLVEFKPSVLAGGPKFRLRDWPEVLTLRETLDLIRTARGGTFAVELLLGELLPTYRSRHGLRDNLLAALRGESSWLGDLNAICQRNWTINAGANVATPRPAFHGDVTESEHRELLSHRFAVHRVNAVYVRRTLDLLAAHNIRAYLVVPPFAPALIARRAATGAEVKYTEYIQSLQHKYPGLTVLDARGAGYPSSVFVDATHLDRRGAVALSADVAAVLRRDLLAPRRVESPSERWVHLPAYHPRPDPVPLEDVEHSRERLGIAWRP